mmetsp:Transcript_375/g.1301  ORF Transcript_375/g.1301 Transcript_375/m.1301 type:complete len:239 (-) Transcript_375:232-948(-)
MMTFQARAIKNGLKCFEAFSEKEADPRCRLNVPAEDVKEFCRVHCEALANALMLLNNSGDGSNSNSNADDEYGCKTRRRQRIASKTKRAIELWDLLELLYKKDELGAQRGSAADTFRRKQSLSKWLKRSLKRAEMEKALEMDAQPMDFDDDDDDDDNNDDKNDVDAETTKSSRDDDDCHSKHAEPISSSLRFGSVAQIPHTGGERNRRRRERVRLANASGDERKSLRTLKQQGRRPRR